MTPGMRCTAILGALLLVGSAVLLAGCSSSTSTTATPAGGATTTTGVLAGEAKAVAAEATRLAAEKSGYTAACAGCHGPTGDGTSTGPSLAASKGRNAISLTRIITLGTGTMAGLRGQVSAGQIAAIIALMKSPDFATGSSASSGTGTTTSGAGGTGTSTTPSS